MTDENIKQLMRKRLETLMSNMSEQAHCAGWVVGNEFILWKLVELFKELKSSYGFTSIEDIIELETLSNHLNEWCVFDSENGLKKGKWHTFIPLEQMEKDYKEWKEDKNEG